MAKRPIRKWILWVAVLATGVAMWELLGCQGKKLAGPCEVERPPIRDPVWKVDTLAVGTQVQVEGVWMASATDAYAVGGLGDSSGHRGIIWRYDGSIWREVYSKIGVTFQDVHGVSPDNVWVVGKLDTLVLRPIGQIALHWDGHQWQQALLDSSGRGLLSVWAESDGTAYAGGYDGTILHWDGARWMPETNPLPSQGPIEDIWRMPNENGSGSQDLYIATEGDGGAGKLLRKFEDRWVLEFASHSPISDGFVGVWGGCRDNQYVLEALSYEPVPYGTVYRHADTTWSYTALRNQDGVFTAIRGDKWGTAYVISWSGIYRLVNDSLVRYNEFPLSSRPTDAWILNLTAMVAATSGNAAVVITGVF
ncbi:MAG: hypothetical protein HY304_05255 [candidate division Zixibacteria bacterium]|nr:hypothetical protein [candidate division Zixibacteria bacterium]